MARKKHSPPVPAVLPLRVNDLQENINTIRVRRWRLRNPERARAFQQKWRLENRERRLVVEAAWRARNREKIKGYQAQYQLRHPDYKDQLRIKRLQKVYRFSHEQAMQHLAATSQPCPICTRRVKLVVDHHHATNLVRGLLCRGCNCLIGLAQDNSDILRRAIHYLDTWRANA